MAQAPRMELLTRQTGPLFVRADQGIDQSVTQEVRAQKQIPLSNLGQVVGIIPYAGMHINMEWPQPTKVVIGRFDIVRNNGIVWASYRLSPLRYGLFMKSTNMFSFQGLKQPEGIWEVRLSLHITDKANLPRPLRTTYLRGLTFKLAAQFQWEVIHILVKLNEFGEREEPIDPAKEAANNVAVSMDDI